ncbi:MAG: phage integrase N-terminal SAM-like domain-containing protein, partial [Waterburya sp.]
MTIANGNASEDTKRTYRSYLKQFLLWCALQEIYPARVKSTEIMDYRSYLISEGKSTNTIALTLIALRHFYKSNRDLVIDNPTNNIKPPKALRNAHTRLTYCNLEQLAQLLNQVELATKSDPLRRLRDRLLICLMAIQGCRVVEIHRANVGDWRRGEHWDLWIEGKNSQRIIALRDDLIRLVESYLEALSLVVGELDNHSPLFISFSNRTFGQRLSRRGIGYLVDNYLTQCNLKRIDNHQSR